MIWRRTVWLLVVAILTAVPVAIKGYQEMSPCRHRSATAEAPLLTLVAQEEPAVGFSPCFVDREPDWWMQVLVWASFCSWVGFFGSFVQDCIFYVRARRRGLIHGRFQLFRGKQIRSN